ncbi:hypothetical protein B0O99DRAFT_591043 [Bisporella sp. PMI_857]|nr:hypothetical protein B0O99DRAFT_591043 [Bisporella sp. PMI_857]
MFENFTFGAQSQMQNHDISASPTDVSFSQPQTSFPFYDEKAEELSDIVERFSAQSLGREREQHFSAWGAATQRPFEVDDEDMSSLSSSISEPSQPFDIPSRDSIHNRRLQRQFNTQLQLSSSHIRDIHALVEDMISSSSQCTLSYRSSQSMLSTPHSPGGLSFDTLDPTNDPAFEVDEGFCEPANFVDFEDELSLRRASTPNGIRKYPGFKWTRSTDFTGVSGRQKVRSQPRMRRRKVVKER